MTATTIRLDSGLRDVLKEQARAQGRTLGEHLQALADEEARRLRFAAVRSAMQASPPDEAYRQDADEWLSDSWS